MLVQFAANALLVLFAAFAGAHVVGSGLWDWLIQVVQDHIITFSKQFSNITLGIWSLCFRFLALSATPLRTCGYFVPTVFPLFAPREHQAARGTNFGRQVVWVPALLDGLLGLFFVVHLKLLGAFGMSGRHSARF